MRWTRFSLPPLLSLLIVAPPALGLDRVNQIAAGYEHTLALHDDGTVWAWGRNDCGQLGDGTTADRRAAVAVTGLFGAQAVTAGEVVSIALLQDGTLRTWGCNDFGGLGIGLPGGGSSTPVAIQGFAGVVAIDSGIHHHLALREDGTVWAWGINDNGQLGNGTSGNAFLAPYPVTGLDAVTAIAGGGWFSLALRSDGSVWAWGSNSDGQLGIGAGGGTTLPVPAHLPADVVAIAAGSWHSLALRSDGSVRAWGLNWLGQLGDGTFQDRREPVQVSGLSDVVAIDAGQEFSLAIRRDGSLWAWGDNYFGQLGNGEWENEYSVPVQVAGVADLAAAVGGGSHSLALRSDGLLLTWGDNGRGQLGTNDDYYRFVPTPLIMLSDTPLTCAGKTLTGRRYLQGEQVDVQCSAYILTQGMVQVDPGAQLELRAPQVLLGPGFHAVAGSRFRAAP
jgi:alpha-tubulin suppressor-like RCC1 family protein